MAHFGSSTSGAPFHGSPPMLEEIIPSRSSSPRFNIADFEQLRSPQAAFTTATRDTSYASQSAIDDLDFARSRSNSPPNKQGRNLKTSLFRTTSKLITQASAATTGLPYIPPPSLPGSGLPSPTKTLASFISSTPSSASRASVRARTASKVLFDNYFTGDSAPLHIGVLQPHSQTSSPDPEVSDGYEPDSEIMETSYTRLSARTRPRRSPTMESTASGYASTLGKWFGGSKQSSPVSQSATRPDAAEENDDPLLSLNVQHAMFPYGPVDPLNPTSFNDLLASAEAVITTYQNAYRQRVAELARIKSELALKEDEVEECETRAQHLKMQLQDLGEQCTAQTQKAEMLEGMLREQERDVCEQQSPLREHRRHSRVPASDSGFESDSDSLHERRTEAVKHAGRMSSFAAQPLFSNDLRSENEMLRIRVAELEGAVEGCLDMISGSFGISK